MKAVVLARGAGRRMRETHGSTRLTPAQQAAADAGQKGMMPVGGPVGGQDARPFLDFVLSALADAGCRDVCLVVAPDHDTIRRYYRDIVRPQRLQIGFAVQETPDGTAHALLAAGAFAGSDPFLVLNADNLYPPEVLAALVALDGPGLPGFARDRLVEESGIPPERVASFALLDVDDRGRLRHIIEKPGADAVAAAGPSAAISMNVWRFDARIFDACRDVPRSARGEYELPEAVGLALTRGVEFRVVPARGAVLDLSQRADVAHVTGRLIGLEPRL